MQHTILITGAGKGIGRAIALGFARAGRHNPDFDPMLILAARTASDLDAIALECRAEGAVTETFACDIGRIEEVRKLAAHVREHHGGVDCLVNNAGVGRFKPLVEMTEEDFDFTMDTNLKGTFFLTQELFPAMEERRSGHIFFITSVAAEKAFPGSSIYCMSKFGQKGLVEVMRLYGRKCNVRITEVLPGAVYTPMWGAAGEQFKPVMMMPEDVASPVVQAYMQPSRTVVEEIVIRPAMGDIQDS